MNSSFTAQQLNHLLDLIPANIYWQDTEGKFLGCNQNVVTALAKSSINDVAGKKLNKIITKPSLAHIAKTIKETNTYIMHTRQELLIHEVGVNEKMEETLYLSKKAPLLGTYGQLCGLIGISFNLSVVKNHNEQTALLEQFKQILPAISL
jgi:two-component system aerobic respiration control sensor histidine kinase ArcB